jgi:hypothetical protein
LRSRKAFAITDTELRLIAAAAIMGLSSSPGGIEHAGRQRNAQHVVDERDGAVQQ